MVFIDAILWLGGLPLLEAEHPMLRRSADSRMASHPGIWVRYTSLRPRAPDPDPGSGIWEVFSTFNGDFVIKPGQVAMKPSILIKFHENFRNREVPEKIDVFTQLAGNRRFLSKKYYIF